MSLSLEIIADSSTTGSATDTQKRWIIRKLERRRKAVIELQVDLKEESDTRDFEERGYEEGLHVNLKKL